MMCAEAVLVEAPDGQFVRACTLHPHSPDVPHRMRFRGQDHRWTHGLARVRVNTTDAAQQALV